MEQPRVGTHYPRSTGEFQAWFRTDADCLDYLDWVRWPGGFTCPSCGHAGGWRLGDGRYECAGCHGRTSVTAGTIFDRTRTPLTVWFTACWLFATQQDGVSAQSLQRLANPAALQLTVTRHGGHCGFLERLSGPSWVERKIVEEFESEAPASRESSAFQHSAATVR